MNPATAPAVHAPTASLHLAAAARAALEADVRARAPAEACGLLLGVETGGVRDVVRIIPVANSADAPARRYHIAPRDLLAAEAAARELGLEVLGAYHSHPAGDVAPSAADLAAAWPWYSYLIAAATDSGLSARAWVLAEDRASFRPQVVVP